MATGTKQKTAQPAPAERAVERKARAEQRLAEVKTELAARSGEVEAVRSALSELDTHDRDAAAAVAALERELVAAEAERVTAQAASLVSPNDETAAALAAAEAACAETAGRLEKARSVASSAPSASFDSRRALEAQRDVAQADVQRLTQLAGAIDGEVRRADADAGTEELQAAMRERVSILERIAAARAELAASEAALEVDRASIADRFCAWPELEGDTTPLDVKFFDRSERILRAFIAFAETCHHNAGAGDSAFGGSSMSSVLSISERELYGVLSGASSGIFAWRIDTCQRLLEAMEAIEQNPRHPEHQARLKARRGARQVARYQAQQQQAQKGA